MPPPQRPIPHPTRMNYVSLSARGLQGKTSKYIALKNIKHPCRYPRASMLQQYIQISTYTPSHTCSVAQSSPYRISISTLYIYTKTGCEDSIHTSSSSVPAHVHLSSHISRYRNRSIHSANTTVEKGSMERMRGQSSSIPAHVPSRNTKSHMPNANTNEGGRRTYGAGAEVDDIFRVPRESELYT